jgi:hypothetical protein
MFTIKFWFCCFHAAFNKFCFSLYCFISYLKDYFIELFFGFFIKFYEFSGYISPQIVFLGQSEVQ